MNSQSINWKYTNHPTIATATKTTIFIAIAPFPRQPDPG
jgi:hypothetical protein